jgi:hypothetical protein
LTGSSTIAYVLTIKGASCRLWDRGIDSLPIVRTATINDPD